MNIPKKDYIAVDLDGTLAVYNGWKGVEHIGEPVSLMVERVKRWLAEGEEVIVMTARVDPRHDDWQLASWHIAQWTKKHIGVALNSTCIKYSHMKVLYDDRCIQVEKNTGRLIVDNEAGPH